MYIYLPSNTNDLIKRSFGL